MLAMLSRVADSIYWMSRYVERAENVARFIDVNLQPEPRPAARGMGEQWAPLVVTTGDHERVRRARTASPTQESVDPVPDVRRRESEFDPVLPARRPRKRPHACARSSRSTMWEEINKFYLMVRDGGRTADVLDDPVRVLRAGQRLEPAVARASPTPRCRTARPGTSARMGRMLERADKTSRILDVKYFILLPTVADVGTPFERSNGRPCCESASALEMYRKRHGRITPANVVDFLMLDREFPARHALLPDRGPNESLHSPSPAATRAASATAAEQRLGRLRAELAYTQVDEVIASGLHEFIDDFQIS